MRTLSGLPPGKTLEGFDRGFQPKADRRQIEAHDAPPGGELGDPTVPCVQRRRGAVDEHERRRRRVGGLSLVPVVNRDARDHREARGAGGVLGSLLYNGTPKLLPDFHAERDGHAGGGGPAARGVAV